MPAALHIAGDTLGEGGGEAVDEARPGGEQASPQCRLLRDQRKTYEHHDRHGERAERDGPAFRRSGSPPGAGIGRHEQDHEAETHRCRRQELAGARASFVHPDGIDGKGEEQPAHEERLDGDERTVPQGDELKCRADDAGGKTCQPHRTPQEPQHEDRPKVVFERLSRRRVLLQYRSHGKSQGRGEAEQDHRHLARLCDPTGHAPLWSARPQE